MGSLALTATTSGTSATKAIGVSSLSGSTGGCLKISTLVATGAEVENRSVSPSGADLATATTARLPVAPGLFSITNAPLNCVRNCSAIRRATMSVLPPAGNGTTIVTVWDGHGWAGAC